MKKILIVLILLIFIGCSSAEGKTERLIFNRQMVQITIDSMEEIDLGNDSEITFKLWGYDLYIADVSATLLKEYKYNLFKLPVTYGVDYEKEYDDKIEPDGSGKYGYYITFEMKNSHGKKYKIDYESTDKDYFGIRKRKIEELSGKIYIKEIK